MIKKILEEKGVQWENKSSNGIKLSLQNDELVIKGNESDLIELADYIVKIALSNQKQDHLHLDELTLIHHESTIKNLIIEKDEEESS